MNSIFQVNEITVKYKPVKRLNQVINSSNDAYNILMQFYPEDIIELQEQTVILYLNRANKIIGGYKVSLGGITSTVVDVRLILSVGLKILATGLVLAHNHPSGNKKPSVSDQKITQQIKSACDVMDISFLDHIILTGDGYLSFADEGLI